MSGTTSQLSNDLVRTIIPWKSHMRYVHSFFVNGRGCLSTPLQNILPHFPILLEVYRGVQATLLVAPVETQINN